MTRKTATLSILFVFVLTNANLFSDNSEERNSVSFDLYGVSYNQYLITYERLLYSHISMDVALGYSPQALFNFYGTETDYSSYYLIQFDVKSYFLTNQMKDLYIGFGMQFDIAPNPLSYKYGKSEYASSSILASYGLVGWKFLIDRNSGFYVDPMFWVYTSTPLGITVNRDSKSKTWGYKLWAPMLSLNVGYLF